MNNKKVNQYFRYNGDNNLVRLDLQNRAVNIGSIGSKINNLISEEYSSYSILN